MFKSKYDYKCDVWSAGVILYIMLVGKPPFNGDGDTSILGKIRGADVKMRNRDFQFISDGAKAFLSKLMTIDENKRPTAKEALKDPWINLGQDT